MSPISLATRVRILVVLVVVVVIGAVSATAYQRFRTAYSGHLDRLLLVMARGAAAVSGGDGLEQRVARVTRSPWRGQAVHVRVWDDGAGGDRVSSLPRGSKDRALLHTPAGAAPAVGRPLFYDVTRTRRPHRAVWLRVPGEEGVRNVVVVHPAAFERRRLDELLRTLVLAAVVIAGSAAVLGGRAVALALRPLRVTAQRLAAVRAPAFDTGDLVRAQAPAELRPVLEQAARLVEELRLAAERHRSLLADAAHQLRTPLSLVRSTLELARESPDTGDAAHAAIGEALEDLGRTEWLVEQILTLSRVDATSLAESAVELRLDALLAEVVAAQERAGGRVACEPLAPCSVRGDERMLRILFEGLLDNAARYGRQGGTVRMALEHGSDRTCTTSVQDDAGAIPPELLPRIFDRFVRGPGSAGRHPRGAGLGLTIAREIARLHGGDVWITSRPGERTTVSVRLPVVT